MQVVRSRPGRYAFNPRGGGGAAVGTVASWWRQVIPAAAPTPGEGVGHGSGGRGCLLSTKVSSELTKVSSKLTKVSSKHSTCC